MCHVGVDRHWTFHDHTLDSISLHLDSAVGVGGLANWQEVSKGTAGPVGSDVKITSQTNKTVELQNIELAAKYVSRVLCVRVSCLCGAGVSM